MNMAKRNWAIVYIRIIAMLFIFIDHATAYCDIPMKSFIIQITNSGVLIFLLISGFLYGGGKTVIDKKWVIGRIKRLMVPCWIFLIIYYSIKFATGESINIGFVLTYFCFLQGFIGTESGLTHLWFLTLLMICYLLIPLLQKFRTKTIGWSKKEWITTILLLLFMQVLLAYFCNIRLDIGHPLSWYLVAIGVFSAGFLSNKYVCGNGISYVCVIISTVLMIVGCSLRVISNIYIDGSVLYDKIISIWTNAIFDIWIFIIVYYVVSKNESKFVSRAALKLDAVSYCFYLVHAVVLSYLSVLSAKPILFFLISFVVSVFCGAIVNLAANIVTGKYNSIKKQ